MEHQPHIPAINAHPEGDSGHQHRPLLLKEARQGPLTRLRIKAGVIRGGINVLLLKPLGPTLHRTSRARIDQRRSMRHGQRFQHLRHRIPRTPLHGVMKVVPAGGTHLHQRAAQGQQTNDVGPHPRSRCCAEGQHGNARTEAADQPEPSVVRTEIMPPGADAVGLIHRQGYQSPGISMKFQHSLGCFALQPLGGQVQQPEAFVAQVRECLLSADGIQACMQTGCGDAAPLQLKHLILHQCNQR